MTTEIESIGLAMDTSGVERGIRSLDELAARGPKVEKSLKGVETAATEAGKGVSSLGASNAKGLDDVAKAGDRAAQGLSKTSQAARSAVSSQQALAAAVAQFTSAERSFVQSLVDEAKQLGMSRSERAAYIAQSRGMSSAAQEVAAAVGKKIDAYKREQAELAALSRSSGSASESMLSLARAGATAFIGGAFVTGVTAASKAMYEASASAERFRMTLNFASAGNGAQEIAYLRKVTQDLGLQFNSTAQAYAGFQAAAKGTALEGQKARSVFESIAKSSAVMGLSASQASGVLLALQQMISKGTVQAEELRGQLGERLPGAFQIAAKAMGVTTAELGKMLEQGQVMADDFLPKFGKALEENLGGAAEKAAQRLDASVNRMESAWERLKQNGGDSGTSTFLASQYSILTDAMTNVSERMEDARAAGGGFASQMLAAGGAALQFINPLNAISYTALSNAEALRQAEQRMVEMKRAAESGIDVKIQMSRLDELIAKLRTAKAERDALAGLAPVAGGGAGRGSVNPTTTEEAATIQAGLNKYLRADARQTNAEIRTEEIRKAIAANGKLLESVSKLAEGEEKTMALTKARAALETEIANINEKHKDKAVAGAKAEQTAYQSTMASIQAKIAENAQELMYSGRLTESDKLRIKLMAELEAGAKTLTASHKADALALIEKLAAQERERDLIKQSVALYQQQAEIEAEIAADYVAQSKAREAGRQAVNDYAKGIRESNDALQYELSLMGLGEQAREVALEQYRIELELKKQIAAIDANSGFENEAQREEERARARAAAAIAKANASSKVFLDNWKESVRQYDDIFRQGFADMLNNGEDGWKSFTKSLATTFRTTVADALYKMFAQPFVVQLVGQIMGITGGGIAGAAGGVSGMVSGASSIASVGQSIYSAITGGFTSLTNSIAMYTQQGLNWLTGSGAMGASALPGGFAQAVGGIGSAAAGIGGGILGGRLISGGYSIGGGSGNGMVNFGTGAGAIVGSIVPGIGTALGSLVGGLLGGTLNRLFGRKLKDSGIEGEFGGETGFEGNTYQYYKGGLFRSSKTVRGELDEELRKALADQFTYLKTGTEAMAETLGLGTAAIDDFTASLKISFQGLSEEEIQAKLEEELAKIGESLASLALGTDEFNRSGETAAEALTRLSGSLVAVNSVFDNLGETLYATSLAGADMASQLVDLFGGANAFGSATGSYFQNFYSEDEQRAAMQRQLEKQLGTLNLKLPDINANDARAQYRALAESMDRTTEEGRKAWAMLIQLSGAFADLTVSTGDAKKAAEEHAKAEQDAAKKAAEEARKQLIDSTYSLFQRALSRDRDALSEQASAISEVISAISSSVDMLNSNARELYGTVDSTAQMLAAQGMVYIEQALAGVRGGKSLTGYEGLTDAISAARGGISGGNYATEFDRQRDTLVLAGQLSELGELGDLQLSVEERQLKGINAQLDALESLGKRADALVNGTQELTDTVDGYFAKLIAILAPEKTPGTGGAAGGGSGASYGPTWGGTSTAPKYSRPVSYTGGVIYQGVTQEEEKRLDQYASGYHAFDGTGDAAGLNAWIAENNLKPSDLSALSGLFGSDWEAWFKANGLSFAVGTNYVPHDMVAQIHKGERIIPEADNRALIAAVNGGGQGGDVQRLEALVGQLIEDRRKQSGEILRLQNRLAKVLEKWDVDGMPKPRDEEAIA